MSSSDRRHHHNAIAPAWSIIILTSSVPIAFAIVIIGLTNISPFAGNIIGLTYSLAISLFCAFVVLATHYPHRATANAKLSSFLVCAVEWLDVIGHDTSDRSNQLSEHTQERLRIAAGGVVRAPSSLRSITTTLPPYTPQRPDRALLAPPDVIHSLSRGFGEEESRPPAPVEQIEIAIIGPQPPHVQGPRTTERS